MSDQFDHPETIVCPGGPVLLRGRHQVADAQGLLHETTRPVTAVCRCEKSATMPWCDGTHKSLPALMRPE